MAEAPTPGECEPEPTAEEVDGPDRRRFLAAVGGGAVVVALGGGLAAWRLLDDPAPPVEASPVAPPPPSLVVATSTTLPTLPVPDALPENSHAPTPQVVIGTIELPRIGVTADIQEGVTLTAINRGPGHWPNTAMPGAWGNAVLAGHRTTYSKPFNRLNELQPGDPVTMRTAAGTFVYEVRGVVIVPGEAIDIAAQSYAHTATLFACHPPGSARQRIVAKLRLLAPDGTPVDPDSALPPLDAGTQETDHTLTVGPAPDPLTGSAG